MIKDFFYTGIFDLRRLALKITFDDIKAYTKNENLTTEEVCNAVDFLCESSCIELDNGNTMIYLVARLESVYDADGTLVSTTFWIHEGYPVLFELFINEGGDSLACQILKMVQRNYRELYDINKQQSEDKKMENLKTNSTYIIGDFILRMSEDGTLRVTSDRGVVSIHPKADNAVEIKSTKGGK